MHSDKENKNSQNLRENDENQIDSSTDRQKLKRPFHGDDQEFIRI